MSQFPAGNWRENGEGTLRKTTEKPAGYETAINGRRACLRAAIAQWRGFFGLTKKRRLFIAGEHPGKWYEKGMRRQSPTFSLPETARKRRGNGEEIGMKTVWIK